MSRRFRPFGTDLTAPLSSLRREMDTLFDQFFRDEQTHTPERFAPSVNIAESEREYEITAELPGVSAEEIDIELQDGQLVIRGEKKKGEETKDKTFHRVERFFGQFQRIIPINGPVDEEKVSANFKDGVLHVVIPKAADAKPRKIEVKG